MVGKCDRREVDALSIDLFNSVTPIGTEVIQVLDDGTERRTTTRSEAWMLGGHTPVVMLTGVSGCYALNRVKIDPLSPDAAGGGRR
jgi:hypothetical protein